MNTNTEISYENYLKGVNGELPYDELLFISQNDAPCGDYYNYESIRNVLLRKLKGEIDDEYFRAWIFVMIEALNDGKHYHLFDFFDGCAWDDTFSSSYVLEILAYLKDFNYRLLNKDFISEHKKEKLKVVYLRFEHCNWTEDSIVYKAYFVDYENKRFDIRFVDDAFFDFNDDIMYCFIFQDDNEFLSADEDEIEFVEPKELPEEEQLMSYFYNENEKWIYDHNLNF